MAGERYKGGYKPDIYIQDRDKKLRYVLGNKGERTLICVGINPNVACDTLSDKTMNTLISFAAKNGYDSCVMINPYPLICAKPKDLPESYDEEICNENMKHIEAVFDSLQGSDVLVMWGDRINIDAGLRRMVKRILDAGIRKGMRFLHINDLSKTGNPYHFMYLCKNKAFNQGEYTINSFDAQLYIKTKCG